MQPEKRKMHFQASEANNTLRLLKINPFSCLGWLAVSVSRTFHEMTGFYAPHCKHLVIQCVLCPIWSPDCLRETETDNNNKKKQTKNNSNETSTQIHFIFWNIQLLNIGYLLSQRDSSCHLPSDKTCHNRSCPPVLLQHSADCLTRPLAVLSSRGRRGGRQGQ